jgi:hypothetical protein
VPANFNELTIEEANNAFHGPTAACVGSAPASPPVTFTPAALTFTGQTVGTTSLPSTITVTNVSTTPNLAVTAVAITGTSTNPGDFAIASGSDTCTGAKLALEASCTIGVTFTPAFPGGRSATLSITDNASGSPQLPALNGNGTP